MKVRVLGQAEVRALLPMAECIEVMEKALASLGRGDGVNPLRTLLSFPDGSGLLGMMPSYLADPPAVGIKAVTVLPGNHGTALDSHQGAVLLFEPEGGRLLAVIDASEITAVRTAAVSGLASRLLAREDSSRLAILGTGVQAATHLAAVLAVRPITEARIWSRDPEHVRAFVERESAASGVDLVAAASAREAVEGADVICTTTSAREPILLGDWIAPGAHVNAVGSSVRSTRELDTAAVVGSSLFVDRRESTLNEAGDFLFPLSEGALDESHIRGELGEILLGACAGRRSPEEVTLFKSLGLGVEDLAAAHHVYHRSLEEGVGTAVEFSGSKARG